MSQKWVPGGYELPNAPKLTLSGLVRYGFVVGERTAGSFAVDYRWQDEVFKEVTNHPVFVGTSYGLLGARVALDWPRFGVAVWGKNLTDEVYVVDAFDISALGYGGRVYGLPRSYGVSLIFNG